MIPHGTAKLVRVNYRLELSRHIHSRPEVRVSFGDTYPTPRIYAFISNKNYSRLPQRKPINLSLVFLI